MFDLFSLQLLLQLLFWSCISIALPAYMLIFLCRFISNKLCKSAPIEESARLKLPMNIVLPCLMLSILLLVGALFAELGILIKLGNAIAAGYIAFVRPLLMMDPMGLMQHIDAYTRYPFFNSVLMFSQIMFILYGIITFVVIMKLNYKNRRCSLLSLCVAYILSFFIADVIQFMSTAAYIIIMNK